MLRGVSGAKGILGKFPIPQIQNNYQHSFYALKEYEIISKLIYNRKYMQVRVIMIVHAHGYNSLRYTTLHYKVWTTRMST